jgi:hypothetical protein
VSAANFQAGQAEGITDLISALWKASLMLALKRLLLNNSEGLGFNHFCVQSPCNPLIENYTQIFHMVDEGDILSIQCKMNLRWPKSMGEVYGLNLLHLH